MIVTLTLNPSLDRTVELPFLARGAVIRALAGHRDPGGKGVNVARALLANGAEARAVLPVGGRVGHQLVELLEAEGVAMTAVEVGTETRSNLTLSEPDGTVTKVNEAGGALTAADIERLTGAVIAAARPGDWVIACGRVPPFVPEDIYARLTTRLTAHGVRVGVDTSGPALLQALAAGPALVKPNRAELTEAVGREVRSLADACEAATELRRLGAAAVLVSLGPDGAMLVDADGVAHASCTVDVPRSSVGAGDCLLAGFLAAGARGEEALTTAVQWAAAAVALPGSRIPSPADIDGRVAQVRRDVDHEQLISRTS
ncbi:MAG: 1-phosphofructokinase family hexose kinase [Acidimicrobiales bacterium]